jgi:hypothetical protein
MTLPTTTLLGASLGLLNFGILTIRADDSRMLWGALLSAVLVPIARLIWVKATRAAQRSTTARIISGEQSLDLILETIDPIAAHPRIP